MSDAGDVAVEEFDAPNGHASDDDDDAAGDAPGRNVNEVDGMTKDDDDDDEDDEDEAYEVEAICEKRWKKKGKKYMYLVKWKGYGEDQNTWEPMSNLVGAEDAVKTFEEKDKAERLAKTAASAAKSKGKKKPVKEASDDEMSEDRLSKPSVASKKRAAPESDSSEKSYGMRSSREAKKRAVGSLSTPKLPTPTKLEKQQPKPRDKQAPKAPTSSRKKREDQEKTADTQLDFQGYKIVKELGTMAAGMASDDDPSISYFIQLVTNDDNEHLQISDDIMSKIIDYRNECQRALSSADHAAANNVS